MAFVPADSFYGKAVDPPPKSSTRENLRIPNQIKPTKGRNFLFKSLNALVVGSWVSNNAFSFCSTAHRRAWQLTTGPSALFSFSTVTTKARTGGLYAARGDVFGKQYGVRRKFCTSFLSGVCRKCPSILDVTFSSTGSDPELDPSRTIFG